MKTGDSTSCFEVPSSAAETSSASIKIEGLFVDLFLDAHQRPPKKIILL